MKFAKSSFITPVTSGDSHGRSARARSPIIQNGLAKILWRFAYYTPEKTKIMKGMSMNIRRKIPAVLLILPLIGLLAACSSVQIPGVNAAGSAATPEPNQPGFSLANQPVENKLAIGILKLEGTDQAVTAKQAADLLPLWKAVKSMGVSSTTAPAEMQAVYTQIQQTLTPQQVQAIKDLNLSQTDMSALMQKYGVQFAQGARSGANGGTITPSQRATRVAQFQGQGGGNRGGGVPGGGVPGGGGGGFTGGGQGGQNPNVQRTPSANQARGGGFRGGLNVILADPVIKILQQRAGA